MLLAIYQYNMTTNAVIYQYNKCCYIPIQHDNKCCYIPIQHDNKCCYIPIQLDNKCCYIPIHHDNVIHFTFKKSELKIKRLIVYCMTYHFFLMVIQCALTNIYKRAKKLKTIAPLIA